MQTEEKKKRKRKKGKECVQWFVVKIYRHRVFVCLSYIWLCVSSLFGRGGGGRRSRKGRRRGSRRIVMMIVFGNRKKIQKTSGKC